jgi:peptidoglycan-associated lipoprotein
MGNAVRLSFALLLLVVLPACSSNRAKTPDAAATMTPPAATSEPGVVATPLDPEGVVGAGMAAEPNEGVVDLPPELVDRRVIYFSYDSDTLGPTEIELVAAHARFMSSRTGVRLRLDGHTDERGAREYNIGLGERRAQAVRRALSLNGVADARLTTVSYGEEQPAAMGSDEASLKLNRRVELVYAAQ